jgi:hypothetical protein
MKKKNFLSGIGAKLALAVVALTTVVFTSCEKEEFNVEPVELPNASATLAITVYSLEDGSVLQNSTETIAAGADGTIAAQTKTIAAPSIDGYLKGADATVTIPQLAKGQFAMIPVNFYLQSELGAAKDPIATETEKEEATPVKPETSTFSNDTDFEKLVDAYYYAKNGQEVQNLDEVYSYIDKYVPDSRALSTAEVRAVLKALVKSYDSKFTTEKMPCQVRIPAHSSVTLNPTTAMYDVVYTITTTVEGTLYTIPNVKIKKAGNTTYTETSNSHDGHDGHGNSSNAGGGAGGK